MPTDQSLIGSKVAVNWGTKGELIVKILGLCFEFPKTAYQVTWSKQDNPSETWIPDDCAGAWSIAHFSQIIRRI